jgi:hypothetical protein
MDKYEMSDLFYFFTDEGKPKECKLCGAGAMNAEVHLDWHNKIARELEGLWGRQ